MAWKVWSICDRFARPVGGFGGIFRIEIKSVIETCRVYGTFLEDFEKVLLIEDIIFPRVRERMEREREQQETVDKMKRTVH